MQQEGRLIGQQTLANGLEVYFYDLSKEILGDRWQVRLLIQIPIELKNEYLELIGQPLAAADNFIRVVGPTLYFEVEKQLNFVESKKLTESLESLKMEFMRTNLNYLSRPDFAAKFVSRRYQEWFEKEQMKSLRDQHVFLSEKAD